MGTNEQIFWTFFIFSTIGFVLAVCKMAYKLKCKEVSFECIKIIKDAGTEEKEEEFIKTHSLSGDHERII